MAARSNLHQTQFVDFYHSSLYDFAPHLAQAPQRTYLFGGTKESALDRAEADQDRAFMHHYRIPRHMIRSEVWADDQHIPERPYSNKRVNDLAPDPGPTLWETVPVDPRVKRGEVLQYRNHHEDPGSISYIIHKSDARRGGPIEYLGVTQLHDRQPELEEDDDSYSTTGLNGD